MMYTVIHDRIFWIYFIVTFFFIIIGIGALLTSNNPHIAIIAVVWLLSNIALMILVYNASVRCAPVDNSDYPLSFLDVRPGYFSETNLVWLLINFLFIALLIMACLWAGELKNNNEDSQLRTMSGILILSGGLILAGYVINDTPIYNEYEPIGPDYLNFGYFTDISFWMAVGYLLIWLGLTLYVVLMT